MSRQFSDFIFRFLGVNRPGVSELYRSDHTADAMMYSLERLEAHPDCFQVDVYKYSTLERRYVHVVSFLQPRAKVVE